jgi:hypothetical protein
MSSEDSRQKAERPFFSAFCLQSHPFRWHHGAPQGGPGELHAIGNADSNPPDRGRAGTLNNCSRSLPWHCGHSTVSPLKTSSVNVCSHLRQAYSYSGMSRSDHERRFL